MGRKTVTLVKAWSYSRYACYALCPLQFKLRYIDKAPEPGSPAMERGNRVHVALAAYLKGTAAAPPPEAVAHAAHARLIEEIKAAEDKVVEEQWGFTNTWKPTGWFSKDTWFRSIIDVAVAYEDNTLEDVDWKTGKRYGSNDEQMESQALSVMCKYQHITHVTTRLAYLDSGDEEIAEFEVRLKPLLRTKWEKKVAPMFVDDMFVARPNNKCGFCAFSKSKGGQCKFG